MCDVCLTVYKELKAKADELTEKYPGSEIDGQKVPRRHHVNTALRVLGEGAMIDEMTGMAEIAQEGGDKFAAGPFQGNFKVIEGQ